MYPTMFDPTAEPEFQVSERSEHFRAQNYRREWEQLPGLEAWLMQGKNEKRARCTYCDIEMTADLCVIKSHGKGFKHRQRINGRILEVDSKTKPSHYNPKWENDPEYSSWLRPGRVSSKAECSLCDVEFRAEKTVLRNHAKSQRHAKAQSHAKRVQQMAQIWVTEKKLFTNSSENECTSVASSSRSSTPPPTYSDGDQPPTEAQITKLLTSYIVKGFKKLTARCDVCQSSLLRDQEGTELCVVCKVDADGDEGYFLNVSPRETESEEEEEEETNIVVCAGVESSEEPDREEARGRPSNNTDDSDLVYYEVLRQDDPLANMCVIQGLDLSGEMTRLVRSLRQKLVTLNTRISAGENLELSLSQLSKTVALLQSIKQL